MPECIASSVNEGVMLEGFRGDIVKEGNKNFEKKGGRKTIEKKGIQLYRKRVQNLYRKRGKILLSSSKPH